LPPVLMRLTKPWAEASGTNWTSTPRAARLEGTERMVNVIVSKVLDE
jgi:hypothetical protein